jgi:DNA-binding Xre family transcriptional regulator
MRTVVSRLKTLIAEKEIRERRTIGIRTIAEESGASRSTVERMLNNTIKRPPLDDLAALCIYLQCDVGDLLRMEEVEAPQQR